MFRTAAAARYVCTCTRPEPRYLFVPRRLARIALRLGNERAPDISYAARPVHACRSPADAWMLGRSENTAIRAQVSRPNSPGKSDLTATLVPHANRDRIVTVLVCDSLMIHQVTKRTNLTAMGNRRVCICNDYGASHSLAGQ